jgi:putative ATP-dependent endonuclease of OLD family
MAQKHEEEAEPFFPILAAEEPEAHLHPNAQRSLFRQLVSSPGQVIISTHSPYLAAMCNLGSIRYLTKVENSATCLELIKGLSVEELNVLHREVLRHKGELLFAKAIILFEGATEEQIFPAMFEAYFGVSPFERGVTLMQVGGKNYPPFVKLAISFGIPTFIVSDNDKNTKKEIESQISKMEKLDGLKLGSGLFCAAFLSTGNDLEAELINELSLENEIIESLVNSETSDNDNSQYVTAKTAEISALGKDDLIERMRGKKTSYSSFLSEVVLRNPNDRPKGDLIPKALLAAFTQIEKWLANS